MRSLIALRAFPTLLRIGFSEAVAYRAEFIVWILTTTLPFVMMALWTAVTRNGVTVGGYDQEGFVAYYLAALIVRTLTSSWVVWEMNQEIRSGTLSLRLLRPIHPFVAYAAEHIAALPLRALLTLPVAVALLVFGHDGRIVTDPLQIVLLPLVLAGAWLVMFTIMFILGTLGLFLERSMSLMDVWYGVFGLLSGYLVPLELMGNTVVVISKWLPLRYLLDYPATLIIGKLSRAQVLEGLAIQWAWVLVLALLARVLWKRGIRRFESVGA